MRILVLGAGATGGYFGGRLLEAGCNVSFLVRPARAEALRRTGLVVESPFGDIRMPVRTVTRQEVAADHDIVLLSCKAWDLDDAIASLRPAMGPQTQVLPVLNGLAHLDRLDQAFGQQRVLGGLCQIAATLTPEGVIRHLNRMHVFVFGPRTDAQREVCERLIEEVGRARIEARQSDAILLEMWEKWVLLATLAAVTCLMRGTIGDVMAAPGGEAFIRGVLGESGAMAAAQGHPVRPDVLKRIEGMLTEPGSAFAASMLRDLEAGGRIEADHIIGDLLRRAETRGLDAPLLRVAYVHLKAYEHRRDREAA